MSNPPVVGGTLFEIPNHKYNILTTEEGDSFLVFKTPLDDFSAKEIISKAYLTKEFDYPTYETTRITLSDGRVFYHPRFNTNEDTQVFDVAEQKFISMDGFDDWLEEIPLKADASW